VQQLGIKRKCTSKDLREKFAGVLILGLDLMFLATNFRSWVESLPKEKQYVWRRQLEAWQYGSGFDYNG
jgi:hypothetical protein